MATASPRLFPSSPLQQRSPTFRDPNPNSSSPLDSFASDPLFSLSSPRPSPPPPSPPAHSPPAPLPSPPSTSRTPSAPCRSTSARRSSPPTLPSSPTSPISPPSTPSDPLSPPSTPPSPTSAARFPTPANSSKHTTQLSNLYSAANLIHNTSRLLKLSAKLRSFMSSPKPALDLAKAAEMHLEMELLYEERGLGGISVVEEEIRWLSETGNHLRSEAIMAVERGMDEINQNDIWCGRQVFYNLGELRSTVDALINKYKGIGVKSVGAALDNDELQLPMQRNNLTPLQYSLWLDSQGEDEI